MLLLPSVCVSALAIKFPGADGYLAHARAPDSRTDASRFFFVLRFLFCFFSEKKENSQPGGTFSCHRPGCGSSAGCYSPWLPGEREPPLALGGLESPHRQPPDNFEAPPASTEKSGRARACTRRAIGTSSGVQPARLPACNRHIFRRATGTSCGVQTARLPANNSHALRRATGASRGAQPARLAACSRRVLRRATGMSCGVQPTRLCGVHPAPSGAPRRVQEREI